MKIDEDQKAIGDLLAPEITELIETRQVGAVRAVLEDLVDPEIAEVLMAMEPQHRVVAFRLIPQDRASEVFSYFEEDEQLTLIESLTGEQAAALLSEMDPDDRANFFAEAPEEVASSLMSLMRPAERAETQKLLTYPEESVGRIMTPDYLTVHPEWSVQQAMAHIRREGRDAETLSTLYVVNDRGCLINHLSLRRLILSNPWEKISSLLEQNIQTVRLKATDDREKAVEAMQYYDLPAMPVVDENDVMVGIITFDDVADVAEEEATEDMQKMGGMAALDMPYLSTPVLGLVAKRVVWLAVLFVGGIMTVSAMGVFHDSISRFRLLQLFIPLIIASGGNSGSQAATLMIRSLAVREIALSDWRAVFRRELIGGVMLGACLGLLGMGVGVLVALTASPGDAEQVGGVAWFGVTIGLAILSVVTVGAMTGAMLPFFLQRIGMDPATSSTPFVATVVDVTGLVIYFGIAQFILRGVLG